MPTTRSQRAQHDARPDAPAKRPATPAHAPPPKRAKPAPHTVVAERGHIYFFYRPRVQHPEAHALDDVKSFHMLLVPRPPAFAAPDAAPPKAVPATDDMALLAKGADAVPAPAPRDEPHQHYRLVTVGKKHLPDAARNDSFWAAVTAVGDDLHALERGLGPKTYDTKTRGTRHDAPARLAARGAYALVNSDPGVPSKRSTHLGYCLSHPADPGDVQDALGLAPAGSFVLQVKNPLAPASGAQRGRRAEYPDEIMQDVFGRGERGREEYGLRFASCERPDLLDYQGAELLLIAAHAGEKGLEQSLREGRGDALKEHEDEESTESVDQVLRELDMDKDTFPAEPLEGQWI